MSIREVIEMLVEIFKYLGEIFGGMFNKEEDSAETEETPEA